MNHEHKSREELFTDPEELVTFAQAYYATEFPNDERRDCPPAEALREAARAGKPPDEALRSHLFGCSECFRSFRSARMGGRAQAAAAGPWRGRLGAAFTHLRSPWARVAAGVSCLVFLGLITAALWRTRTDSPDVTVNYSPRVNPPAAPTGVTDNGVAAGAPEPERSRPRADPSALKVAPRATKGAARRTRTQPPLPVVYINLKEDDLLRGDDGGGAGRRVITLSPKRQRLHLRMPRGSAAGRYTIRVVDAYGKPLLTAAARSGGKTLTVELDLRGLTAKLYRLCLSRDGEAPDCYLMSVGANPSAP